MRRLLIAVVVWHWADGVLELTRYRLPHFFVEVSDVALTNHQMEEKQACQQQGLPPY